MSSNLENLLANEGIQKIVLSQLQNGIKQMSDDNGKSYSDVNYEDLLKVGMKFLTKNNIASMLGVGKDELREKVYNYSYNNIPANDSFSREEAATLLTDTIMDTLGIIETDDKGNLQTIGENVRKMIADKASKNIINMLDKELPEFESKSAILNEASSLAKKSIENPEIITENIGAVKNFFSSLSSKYMK